MLNIILLFFPAIFSISIDNKINSKIHNKFDILSKYVCYTFFITLLCFTTIYITVGSESYWSENVNAISFVSKYLAISFVYAILLPIIYKFIKSNFFLKISFNKSRKMKK